MMRSFLVFVIVGQCFAEYLDKGHLEDCYHGEEFKHFVDWNKLGELKEIVLQRMRDQGDPLATFKQCGVAAHLRQGLKAAGIAETDVGFMVQALVNESHFKSSVDWTKLSQLRQRVFETFRNQGEDVAVSERRGVAAHVRRELAAAGVPEDGVGFVEKGLVDESALKESINFSALGHLKERVLQRLQEQEDQLPSSEQRGIAALVRQELKAAGVSEDAVISVAQGLVDESEFSSSVNWTKLAHLKQRVEERLTMQEEEIAPAERRGVAAFMREEVQNAGVAEDQVCFFVRGLVNESTFKSSVDWDAFGQIDHRVLTRLASQEEQTITMRMLVWQELIHSGVPEDYAGRMVNELVDESQLKRSVDWNKLRHLKQHVVERLAMQAELVTPSQQRGIAAHMRQELAAAGIPEDRVHVMSKGLVDESQFRPGVEWNRLGELKQRVLQNVKEHIVPSDRRGVAGRVREELVAIGIPEEHVHSMAKVFVNESKFKTSIDWLKLGKLKSNVLERVGKQREQTNPSERRGVAANMRQALVDAGVPANRVQSMTWGLVDESQFKISIDWSELGQLKEIVLDRLKTQDEQSVPSERHGVAAHVRQGLVAVGVSDDNARIMAKGLVDESEFKSSVDWSRLGKSKARVLEQLKIQGAQIKPPLRHELIGSGILEADVDFMMNALVGNCSQPSINTLVSRTGDSVDVIDSDNSLLRPELVLTVFASVFTMAALLGLVFHHTYYRNSVKATFANHCDMEAQHSDVTDRSETKTMEAQQSDVTDRSETKTVDCSDRQ